MSTPDNKNKKFALAVLFGKPSIRTGVILTLGLTGVYVLAFFLLYDQMGPGVAALAILPVITAGWYLGLWPGLIAGLLLFPLNTLLLNSVGMSGWDAIIHAGGGPGATAGVFLGVISGQISNLTKQLNIKVNNLEQAERALFESENRFRTLSERALAGIYIMQADKFLYVNPALAEMFGYQAEEIIDHLSPRDLTHPDDRNVVSSQINARINGEKESAHYSFRGLHKDGSAIHCEVLGRRIDLGGETAIMGTLLNITERTNAENQIQALNAELEKQLAHLTALRQIDTAITSSVDLHLTLDVVLDQIIGQLKIDAANILLYKPQTQTLEYVANKGFFTDALRHTHVHLGEGQAGRAVLERKNIHLSGPEELTEAFHASPHIGEEGFAAYWAIPLISKGQVQGVLELFHRSSSGPDEAWYSFLEALTGQAAIAIDNAKLFDNLQRSNESLNLAYDTTIEGWSRALDLRDQETEGHSRRVTEMTVRLARHMGVSEEDLVHVRRGALLHDMGKMGVPDSILLKPGKLTEQEWEVMKKHTTYAFELLSPISFLKPALDIPYCHHEKWDGSGYPRGLEAEQIPLAARVFAIADVYDALSSDRPYRKAWPQEKTLDYIKEQSGSHFDPKVVEVFEEVMASLSKESSRS